MIFRQAPAELVLMLVEIQGSLRCRRRPRPLLCAALRFKQVWGRRGSSRLRDQDVGAAGADVRSDPATHVVGQADAGRRHLP